VGVGEGSIQGRFCYEPGRQDVECQMMFPGKGFSCLNIVPAEIGFGFLVGAFDEKALAFTPCQNRPWGIGGGVGEAIVAFAIAVAAHDQGFFAKIVFFVLILPNGTYPAGGKVGSQLA